MSYKNRGWLAGALLNIQIALVACSGGGDPADASVEMLPRDMEADTSLDLGANPCGDGATVAKTFGGTMVVCDSAGSAPTNQCDAEALCNVSAGWGLCTGSQYRARADGRGSPVEAWVKACVRQSNSAPTAPTDELCVCERVIGTDAYDVAWSCTGVPQHKDVRQWHIAVIAGKLCNRVGVNDATTEGHWMTLASFTTRDAAMCCR